MLIGHNDILYCSKSIFNGLNHSGSFSYFKAHHLFKYTDLPLRFFRKKNCLECLVNRAVIFSVITPLDFIFYKYIFVANHLCHTLSQQQRMWRACFFASKMNKLFSLIIISVYYMPFQLVSSYSLSVYLQSSQNS